MTRKITLNISEENLRYLVHHIYQDKQAAEIYLVASLGEEVAELCKGLASQGVTVEDVKGVVEQEQSRLRQEQANPKRLPSGGYNPREFLDGYYSYEHQVFYRQAMRQANAILREAANNK